jgi:hypothetical protein
MVIRLNFFSVRLFNLLFYSLMVVVLLSSCSVSKRSVTAAIGYEFLVQFKAGHNPQELIDGLKKYKLSVVKEVAASMRIWLFKSAHPRISVERLLKTLKAHPAVSEAEINKDLNNRDN